MLYYIVKVGITASLIVIISEVAKKSSFVGAIMASIPLVSVLAMLWLYIETGNVRKVSALSTGIFWLVIPSLVLFLTLPLFLKQGLNFYISLGISTGLTIISYFLMVAILGLWKIKI